MTGTPNRFWPSSLNTVGQNNWQQRAGNITGGSNRLVYRMDTAVDKRQDFGVYGAASERRYLGLQQGWVAPQGTPNVRPLDDIIRRGTVTVIQAAGTQFGDITKDRLRLADWVFRGPTAGNTADNRSSNRTASGNGHGIGQGFPVLQQWDGAYMNTQQQYAGNRNPYTGPTNMSAGMASMDSIRATTWRQENSDPQYIDAGNDFRISKQGDTAEQARARYIGGFTHQPQYDPDEWGIGLQYMD